MTITSHMMAAKGACDYQLARFASACPAGLDTANPVAVKQAMEDGVDLRWIAKRFNVAAAVYEAAIAAATEAYRVIMFNGLTDLPAPGLVTAYANAIKLIDLVLAPPKVGLDEAVAIALAASRDVPNLAKAGAFVALFAGQ